jgi:hypothetical protein
MSNQDESVTADDVGRMFGETDATVMQEVVSLQPTISRRPRGGWQATATSTAPMARS